MPGQIRADNIELINLHSLFHAVERILSAAFFVPAFMQKMRSAAARLCFAIKVFEGVQGEAFFRKFPLLFPA